MATGTPEAHATLNAMADLLVLPRGLCAEVERRHRWEPAPDSFAALDLGTVLVADERVNGWLVHQPRSVASLHLRFGADYLAGIAALFRAGEVIVAPIALARIAFEHAVRVAWLLDYEVTTRQRAARVMLEERASVHHLRTTRKRLSGPEDPDYQRVDGYYKLLREKAEESFTEVTFSGDPHSWLIEGETYARPSAAAKRWSELRTDDLPAEGMYDALSLYVHPVTHLARPEAVFNIETGETRVETDVPTLASAAVYAMTACIDAGRILYGYHGWDVPELDELANATAAFYPDAESDSDNEA